MSEITGHEDGYAQVFVDRQGRVRYWSAICEQMFGYATADVIGTPVDFLVAPAYRERHWQGFRVAMEAVTVDRPQSAANIPVLHACGAVKLHPFRSIQICDAFGWGSGTVVVFSAPLVTGETNELDIIFADALEADPTHGL